LLAEQYPTEQLDQLEISEQPSGGNGEKIFHIFDNTSGKDIVRFHVRKDHPPQDGYWFNFHYHTHHDGFQTHHALGDIYWNKNTPPKWLS
ncbi:YpjP family protein, partial [Bacillus sp. JJ1521]|uniref:YpjP family protein n=1 Tax=Bacillus sp. JJ1521 TaxID=3122957 RepID=UPI002FFD7D2D